MKQTNDTSLSPQCAEPGLFSQIEKIIPIDLIGGFEWRNIVLIQGALDHVKVLRDDEVSPFLGSVFGSQNYSLLLLIYKTMRARFSEEDLRIALQPLVEKNFRQVARDFFRLAQAALKWPAEFFTTVSSKQLSHQELAVLLTPYEDENEAEVYTLLQLIAQAPFSRQQLARALEWGFEALLMFDSRSEQKSWLFKLSERIALRTSSDSLLGFLREARFPVTTRSEVMVESMIDSIQWPKTFTVSAKRWGDIAGAEIKFQITSAADLLEKSQKLVRLAEKWQQTSDPSVALASSAHAGDSSL